MTRPRRRDRSNSPAASPTASTLESHIDLIFGPPMTGEDETVARLKAWGEREFALGERQIQLASQYVDSLFLTDEENDQLSRLLEEWFESLAQPPCISNRTAEKLPNNAALFPQRNDEAAALRIMGFLRSARERADGND